MNTSQEFVVTRLTAYQSPQIQSCPWLERASSSRSAMALPFARGRRTSTESLPAMRRMSSSDSSSDTSSLSAASLTSLRGMSLGAASSIWAPSMRYEYDAMDPEVRSIRLVTLLPGTYSSRIVIHINNEPWYTTSPTEYEALSYHWGSKDKSAERSVRVTVRGPTKTSGEENVSVEAGAPDEAGAIMRDVTRGTGVAGEDSSLAITPSLATALNNLRYANEPRILWVDAICINQDDLVERSEQVTHMAQIYSHAFRVIAWLGLATNDSDHALSTLEYLASMVEVDWHSWRMVSSAKAGSETHWADSAELLPWDIETWDAVFNLLFRPYFERLWVQQEVQLNANRVLLMCGDSVLPWTQFAVAIVCTYKKANKRLSQRLLRRLVHIFYLVKPHDIQQFGGLVFETTIESTQFCTCSDPRDSVYALLSFLGQDDPISQIVVDYTKSAGDVYKDVALAYIRGWSSLEFLCWRQAPPKFRDSSHQLQGAAHRLQEAAHRQTPPHLIQEPELKPRQEREHHRVELDPAELEDFTLRPGPSWVTDWTNVATGPRSGKFFAAGHTRLESFEYDGENALKVIGKVFGTVAKVDCSLSIVEYLDDDVLAKGLQKMVQTEGADEPYVAGGTYRDALLRALSANTFWGIGGTSKTSAYTTMRDILLDRNGLPSELENLPQDAWHPSETLKEVRRLLECIRLAMAQKVLIHLHDGHVGAAPYYSEKGDIVCILLGCPAPMLLSRRNDTEFEVVGPCYVHGAEDARALLGDLPDDVEREAEFDDKTRSFWTGFKNYRTGEWLIEDPRYGPLPSDWRVFEHANSHVHARYQRRLGDEKWSRDTDRHPVWKREALEERGNVFRTLKLV